MKTLLTIAMLAVSTSAALAQAPTVPTGIDVPGPACIRWSPDYTYTRAVKCDALALIQDAINNRRERTQGTGSTAAGDGSGSGGGGSDGPGGAE